MQDFEKLGAFYLGKRFDAAGGKLTEDLTLYDAKDLTTHAMIIGMTGSGKTGLGISLIEEAAIDHVPVIAIDPKGDIGNLLLGFPALEAADFEPWVDPGAAVEAGRTLADFAKDTAALWRNGLAKWGQAPERIAKLHDSADMRIYTPGSTAATPVSVLKTLSAHVNATADPDAFRERVQSTVQSILTLLDIDADPLTSREHILLSNILSRAWERGENIDLPGLIMAVQNPPLERIGVMDIDAFYPARDRFALAMRINNLLAAPGFEVWTQGAPLDIQSLLYAESGKPRVSIMSIAHLSDAERMFFVTALLSELVAWMRAQTGSPSLRAILYMDEVFGYLPPVANPPSKQLFLTLLKQARAYGLGLVLATQNPVDLDYKALSNMGTWMIGRLQTKRDIDRVRGGLESAAGGGNLDFAALDATLAGLPKRCFLLHNVHDSTPEIFQTRWALSYLAGPLTPDQIKRLAADTSVERAESAPPAPAATPPASTATAATPPLLDPAVKQVFLPPARFQPGSITYVPQLVIAARVKYARSRPNIEATRDLLVQVPVSAVTQDVDWDAARDAACATEELEPHGLDSASYGECPSVLGDPRALAKAETAAKRWIRATRPLVVYKSGTFDAYSSVGETEGAFRARLQMLGNQERDTQAAALRRKYETEVEKLKARLQRAEHAVAREADQARSHKIDTALSFGTAILGALLGRKAVSATSANRVGTALRKAGRASQQSADVERAEEVVETVQAKLAALAESFDAEVAALDSAYDAQQDELTAIEVAPKLTDIDIRLVATGWVPYAPGTNGALEPA